MIKFWNTNKSFKGRLTLWTESKFLIKLIPRSFWTNWNAGKLPVKVLWQSK